MGTVSESRETALRQGLRDFVAASDTVPVLQRQGGFANESSLLKLLYAGMLKASKRWTHPVQNWNLTLSQLAIHFEGRLDEHLAL